jgi:DNA (cytosine-5)-methyltransferase 1
MDLGTASAYFGVEAPNSRRDRKSGAKKRKQEDIESERVSNKILVAA